MRRLRDGLGNFCEETGMNGYAWRCFLCGAWFLEHAAACTSCLESGTIVRAGKRPPAAIDAVAEITTAAKLAKANFTVVHSEAYGKLRLGAGVLLVAYGPPGSGKSTFTTRLLDALDGPVVYQSTEEGLGPTLHARLARCRVRRDDFTIVGSASIDQVVDVLRTRRAMALAVDSVQVAAYSAEELRRLLIVLGPTLQIVIGTCQVNKRGRVEGRERLLHEADVVVRVDSMAWVIEKSRFQPSGVEGSVLREEDDDETA
jgi:predicted ATP-dependent serine protease